MKKLMLLLVILSVSLLLLVGCTTPADETTEGEETTIAAESTTTTVTTDEKTPSERMAENKYGAAALELALTVCEQYYDLRTGTLATSLENKGATTVWPLASFIEMLAEAYRAFPENETIQKYYESALDRCLVRHQVSGATIIPYSGEVYTNITYYNAGPNWQGDFYYDDNAWICIQLFDAYKLLGDEKYLTLAEKILEFMWTGWDDRAGGGIYWDKTFSGKGICCNGPVAISYCVGYQLTQKEEYLTRAKMIYDWCGRLLRGSNGIYNAGVKSMNITDYQTINLDPWQAAYDQGTMISSAALLYEITGEQRYYDEMSQTATAWIYKMFSGNNMNRNPIFKSWCVGWCVRGYMLAHEAGDETSARNFMRRMDTVLTKTLATKDENGHYDPFFCAPGTDFWEEEYFDNDVIMPTGVATVLFLVARYQEFQK